MPTHKLPKVTVLMPVFNGSSYLKEAIESILTQTFTDFEFLIIDDGSTDNSFEIISSYSDSRIRLVRNPQNFGLVFTLNRGIDLSLGMYIARMDCDDVSLPMRLEKQVAYMDEHPDVGVCSSWVKIIGDSLHSVWDYPVSSEVIKCWLLFESVLPHPSAVLRTAAFRDNNLYYESSFMHAEDYRLWVRAASNMSLANIGEVLLLYRVHSSNVGTVHSSEQAAAAFRIRMWQLAELGIVPDSGDADIHQAISQWHFRPEKRFLEQVELWLCKLKTANAVTKIYSEPAFSMVLASRWISACETSAINGVWTLLKFNNSQFRLYLDMNLSRKLKFYVKCICRMVW